MKEKKSYLEVLRVIAIVCVLYMHLPAIRLYQGYSGAMQIVFMSFTMLTKICIPLFLMISGAVLLGKNDEYRSVLTKRCPKILGAIICFSLLYYVFNFAIYGGYVSIGDFVQRLLSRDIEGLESYWYLYSYLGFLLMLPFMQKAVKGMKNIDFIVLFLIHFILSTLIPMANIFLAGNGLTTIAVTSDFFVPFAVTEVFMYPIFGYYIDHVFDITKLEKKHAVLVFALLILILAIVDIFTVLQGKFGLGYSDDNVYIADYLFAICIFVISKYFCVNKGINSKVIASIGALTFGIYLLDPFLKLFIYDYYKNVTASMHIFISSILWIVLSMLICGGVTFILKKIPFLRDML